MKRAKPDLWVGGVSLANDQDEVIGMITVHNEEDHILVVSEKGYGKRSSMEDYRVTNRGGKGVKTISITEKTGGLVAIKNVTDSDDLMIINKSGIAIRLGVEDLRVMGRATQGVKLINIRENDSIAAVAKVMKEEEEEILSDGLDDSGASADTAPEAPEATQENSEETGSES